MVAFDGKGERSFGNGFARNVVIFVVDNNLSFHPDNRKNDVFRFRRRRFCKDKILPDFTLQW